MENAMKTKESIPEWDFSKTAIRICSLKNSPAICEHRFITSSWVDNKDKSPHIPGNAPRQLHTTFEIPICKGDSKCKFHHCCNIDTTEIVETLKSDGYWPE